MICADLRVSSLHFCSPTERSFTPESLRSLVERSSSFSLEALELRAEARTSQLFSDSAQWLSLHNGKCHCVNVISVKKTQLPSNRLCSPERLQSTVGTHQPRRKEFYSYISKVIVAQVKVSQCGSLGCKNWGKSLTTFFSQITKTKARGEGSNIWIDINKRQGSLNIYKHSQTCTVPFNFQQHSTEGIIFFLSFYFLS